MLNVFRFQGSFVRGDAELLDKRGVRATDDDRRNHGHGDTDRGQTPRAPERCDKEKQSDQERDNGENRMSWKRCVNVGVESAINIGAVLGKQVIAAEPIVRSDEEGNQRSEDARL